MTGCFITFEGGDGAGKSTQIALLAERLRSMGQDVVVTREPGGTPGAETIRALIVTGDAARWTLETDVLLIMAARADHVARLVRPALEAGKIVLCDRYVHSTLAYQGGEGGAPDAELSRLHGFATGGLWPDLTLWLDVSSDEGLGRTSEREGSEVRFEAKALAFHLRVQQNFARLATNDPKVRRVDAGQSIDKVADAIWGEVSQSGVLGGI